MNEAEEMAKRLDARTRRRYVGPIASENVPDELCTEAASLLRSQAAKIEALNQEISDKCDSINVWRAKCVDAETLVEYWKMRVEGLHNYVLEEAASVLRRLPFEYEGNEEEHVENMTIARAIMAIRNMKIQR